MDLNAIKAKAGISDNSSAEKTPISTDSSRRSGDSVGKRRFWYPEQDNSTTSPFGSPPEANSDKNGEQRGSKGVAKGQLNGEQRGSKGVAKGQLENETSLLNGEQRGSKGAAKGQLNGEQENRERGSKGVAKGEQEKATFGQLVGLQRELVLLVYESMQSRGEDWAEPMSSTALAERVSTSRATIKDALRRLKNKGVLVLGDAKTGNGGWVRYGVTAAVKAEIFAWQRGSKGVAKGQLNGEQTAPSSSSYKNTNLLTTTTADVETRACAEDEWSPQDLDYSMLTDIGFGKSQVLQLRSLGIPFDIVQRSLVHFDFELRHTQSGKTIHEPLALLMKRMRQNGCWPAPEEFEKRHAYFRNLFDERDRQIQESPTVSEPNSDTREAWE